MNFGHYLLLTLDAVLRGIGIIFLWYGALYYSAALRMLKRRERPNVQTFAFVSDDEPMATPGCNCDWCESVRAMKERNPAKPN